MIYLPTNLKMAWTELDWAEIGLNAHEGMEAGLARPGLYSSYFCGLVEAAFRLE